MGCNWGIPEIGTETIVTHCKIPCVCACVCVCVFCVMRLASTLTCPRFTLHLDPMAVNSTLWEDRREFPLVWTHGTAQYKTLEFVVKSKLRIFSL